MRNALKSFSILIFLAALAFISFPSVSKYFKLKRHEEGLNYQIADFEKKVEELKKEEYLIKNDPAHIEQIMRKELGLVRPGEVVYKIVPKEASPAQEPAEAKLVELTKVKGESPN